MFTVESPATELERSAAPILLYRRMDLPSVPIKNLDAFLSIVGQWNLYDVEIRGLRLEPGSGTGRILQADLYLHGDNLRKRTAGVPAIEHEFIFQFSDVQDIDLALGGDNIIIDDYEFGLAEDAHSEQPCIRVSVNSATGGNLLLTCREIAILSVREMAVRSAV
jgi:hypothetical protein